MRAILAIAIAALPFAASAQPDPQPGAAGRSITREQFVQRGAEMAGRRFDAIDTTHSGTITRAQWQAYRAAHGGGNHQGSAASQ